jgi:predicted CopG family antitoxin
MSSPKPQASKKPLPKGLKWMNLNYDDFNKRFPRLGVQRLIKRVEEGDESARERLQELRAYTWRNRRKRKYRYPGRYSPSKRTRVSFKTISIHMETYHKIKELQKFYKAGMGAIITPLIDELFEKTYKEAELLARINSRETRDEA